jgi:hypothetical protein
VKKLIVLIALIAFILILVITNPGPEAYSDFLREEMTEEAEREGEVAGALAAIFGGIAESIFESATTRDNYVLFSVYTTELDADALVVLGILGNFIVLSEA